VREIERLTATNQSRQRTIGRKSKQSGIVLRLRSPNKSSLYDVKQNRQWTKARCKLDLRMTFILSTPGNGGAGRDRTDDILLAKQALSQLSYGP
jgi:hypothetical protein